MARRLFAFGLLSLLAGCPGPDGAPDAGSPDAAEADVLVADAARPDAGTDGGRCTVGSDCDDDLFCNGTETCGAGACVVGSPPCAATACDEATDTCACAEPDEDGDGEPSIECGGLDCDDGDAGRAPGHTEVCDAAGLDEDCDPTTFGERDLDLDGHLDGACCNGATCGDDCDDVAADVYPGLVEVCDTRDNDCDTRTDEGALVSAYIDADGDGYGVGSATNVCPGTSGYASVAGDCDDTTTTRSPGTTELCSNTLDDDCDTRVDESGPRLYFRDRDADGFGDATDTAMLTACDPPAGYSRSGSDCNDAEASVHPGATEVCNGEDDDCSAGGGAALAEDRDMDGHSATTATCTGGFPKDDCNDSLATMYGGAIELCDGLDTDCSAGGGASTSEDLDGDLYAPVGAACTGGYPRSDCDDVRFTVHPGAAELCDGLDTDCNFGGGAAPGEDADGDMHAAPSAMCSGGPFARDDCDDTRLVVHPGGVELCDGLDTDCSSGGGALTSEDADGDLHAAPGALCMGGFPRDDCDDGRAAVYAGAVELCDGRDSDCSSGGGPLAGEDADGDFHAAPGAACSGGLPRDDCDDTRVTVYPGAVELCDGRDSDCSSGGGALAAEDADGDLHAAAGAACMGGFARDDCDDTRATVYAGAAELCDRLDTDCSSGGGVLLGEDADGDLHAPTGAACTGGYVRDDCDDVDAGVYPGAPLVAPRLLGPENGALTGSVRAAATGTLRPTFRWRAASCASGVTYELAVDDSCPAAFASCTLPSPEVSMTAIAGTSARPATNLAVAMSAPVGRRYFWRVRACAGACGPWSAVRYVEVGRVRSDLNGDGHSDVVVGGPTLDAGANDEGNVFVYVGSAGGLPAVPSVTIDSPLNQAGARFGAIVVTGDLDADGYADLVVGAPYTNAPATDEGNVYVYRGGATGPASSPSTTLDSPVNQANAGFGTALAVGDADGDGDGDLVVSAPLHDAGAADEGNVFVYFSGAGGLPSAPSRTLDSPRNDVGAGFGTSLGLPGDLDGDGDLELAVGAPNTDTFEGVTFVYAGSATGFGPTPTVTLEDPANQPEATHGASIGGGDVNGDGYADLVVGAASRSSPTYREGSVFVYLGRDGVIDRAPSVMIDSAEGTSDAYFGSSLAVLDAAAPGFAGLAVGAGRLSDTVGYEGRAFVYAGSASGLDASPASTLVAPTPTMFGGFGGAVAFAGDVDGDGHADLVVGAAGDDGAVSGAGRVYLYLASASGIPATPSHTLDCPLPQFDGAFGLSVW